VSEPLFIIGAGFNVDANVEAGEVPLSSAYPLVGQLAETCFGLKTLPPGKSAEQLFHEAISFHRSAPIDKLYDALMQADYFIGGRVSAGQTSNSYLTFLKHFRASHFLTFNYDSLIEILLFALGRWRPDDGYGLEVQTRLDDDGVQPPVRSETLVLHLHGSLLVYSSKFSISWTSSGRNHTGILQYHAPLFVFDPYNITKLFCPYGRVGPTLSEDHRSLDQRVFAPVPDKAKGLQASFISAVHARATELVSLAERVVSIGYSFSPYDRASYDQLVQDLASRDSVVILVSPDATEVGARLAKSYPAIKWIALPLTFRRWVSEGFPGAME
jgi:hypothetical protein